MRDRRVAYRFLMGRPKRMRPLGRPGRKWKDNIQMYLQEIGREARSGLIWLRIGPGGGLL
jgi:hypothetical protein